MRQTAVGEQIQKRPQTPTGAYRWSESQEEEVEETAGEASETEAEEAARTESPLNNAE